MAGEPGNKNTGESDFQILPRLYCIIKETLTFKGMVVGEWPDR